MRALDAKVLFARLEPFLSNQNYSKDTKWQTCVVEHLVTDASKLTDISESIKVYLDDYKWQKPLGFADLLAWDSTKLVWQEWHDWLQKTDVIDYNSVSEIMNAIKKGFDVKGKHLFMPLRVAVIGQMHGADVRVAAPLISKASLIERVAACLSSE